MAFAGACAVLFRLTKTSREAARRFGEGVDVLLGGGLFGYLGISLWISDEVEA